MKKYYYDLHVHSCLSPCADDDITPNSIAGMAKLNKLNIIALTDHNTCENCPYFFASAKRYDIIPIAGMELTTSEDIHVICLFEDLNSAMLFDLEVKKRRNLIENRTDIFGNQLICDSKDNIIKSEKYLLSNATDISFDEVPGIVEKFSGVCYPAHIDRSANSVITILGALPKTPKFNFAELNDKLKAEEFSKMTDIPKSNFIISSDAHYLWDINENENYFLLDCDDENAVKNLFKILRN